MTVYTRWIAAIENAGVQQDRVKSRRITEAFPGPIIFSARCLACHFPVLYWIFSVPARSTWPLYHYDSTEISLSAAAAALVATAAPPLMLFAELAAVNARRVESSRTLQYVRPSDLLHLISVTDRRTGPAHLCPSSFNSHGRNLASLLQATKVYRIYNMRRNFYALLSAFAVDAVKLSILLTSNCSIYIRPIASIKPARSYSG